MNLIEILPTSTDDDDLSHKRVTYTKWQKFAAVGLVLNGKITKKDGSQHPLLKYNIAKKLRITTIILWKWIKKTSDIEAMSKSSRKKRNNVICQKPELETQVLELLKKVRVVRKKSRSNDLYSELMLSMVRSINIKFSKLPEKKQSMKAFSFHTGVYSALWNAQKWVYK